MSRKLAATALPANTYTRPEKQMDFTKYKFPLLFLLVTVTFVLINQSRRADPVASKEPRQKTSLSSENSFQQVARFSSIKIGELSGIAHHPHRQSLFLVNDEGIIYEMSMDGELLDFSNLQYSDLEGITVNPQNNLLYAVVEGDDDILEIDPTDFRLTRHFKIDRDYEGQQLLKKGGSGLEGIAFVPNAAHPEGGTFWISNQSFTLKPGEEPSILCEIVLPLVTSQQRKDKGKIRRYVALPIVDASGLAYDAKRHLLLVLSDTPNYLLEMSFEGQARRLHPISGDEQEGVVLDDLGFLYVTQENGLTIKFQDHRP